jgi:subtilase family serine protease
VRNAFHTEIHQFNVTGESRQANVSDPQIPAALTPVVAGIVSLHNFPRKSFRHDAGIHTSTRDSRGNPQFTTTSGCGANGTQPCYVLGPADFAKVYNIPASLDGTGQQIAIVADSNINPNDAIAFRNLFGLTPATGPTVILNGPDPGIKGPPLGDEGEADLDVQVAGMVAPKATIDLVVSDDTQTAFGIDLSAFYIIDNNIAPVMSESFGNCEAALGTAGNQFYNTLWEQAAAQGITVMIASGDPGSAGCDSFGPATTAATHGLAVSGFASTPFNVAVGGTDFDDFFPTPIQTSFWATTNGAGRESAQGYIHEIPWNDSCAATANSTNLNTVCATANGIVGGSGGPSSVYTKPAWQSGIIPNGIAAGDTRRYIPDVSLFASDGPQSLSFYLVCQADAVPPGNAPSCATSGSFSFGGAGGTSASSPAFAAIMALINQNNGRQGNANPVLYKIAATAGQSCNSSTEALVGSTCAFNDVTKGNNSVPCVGNSPNCSSKTTGTNGVLVSTASPTTPAWMATTGYDLATGLGSVNVTNLATQWPLAVGTFHSTTTSLMLNGGTSTVNITHGTAVTAKVTVTSTSGTPTGDVSLIAPTAVNGGIGNSPLSGGTVTVTGVILPGGSYSVNARYAGDNTFAASTSTPGVPVVVGKENSRLQYGIVTFGAGGTTNATSVVYGSPYILRMDILNSTTNACQVLVAPTTTTGCALDATGTVTITDNGSPLDTGTFTINSAGSAEDKTIQLTGGTHNLSATYSGDISYNATAPVTDAVTVSKAVTATALASSATSVTTGTNVTLTATITSASNSAVGTTGTVTFFNGGTQIGSPVAVTPIAATASVGAGGTAALTTSFPTTGTKSITATYNGDTNYALSSGTAITVNVAGNGSFTIGGSAVTATAGASGPSTITVTPTGGFTGPVNVTCPVAGLPAGVTCAPNPLAINVTGTAAVTGQLTLAVAPPSTTLTASAAPAERMFYAAGTIPASGGKGLWTLSAGAGLGAIFLLFLPGRKRYRAALGLGLVCVLSFTLGCSGYGGGSGGGGLATTTTKLTASMGKVGTGQTDAFTIAVTSSGTAANGLVQLYDGTSTLGSPTSVINGTATINESGLPAGTHSISAHYLGDTNTMASQSGALNITFVGNTTFTITATPAASNGSPTVNLTIN